MKKKKKEKSCSTLFFYYYWLFPVLSCGFFFICWLSYYMLRLFSRILVVLQGDFYSMFFLSLSLSRHPHRCICSSGEKGDHYWYYPPSPGSCKAQATSTFEIVTNTGRIGLRAVTYTDVCLHDIYIYKRNFLSLFASF